MDAPLFNNSLTIALCLPQAAQCRGVSSDEFLASVGAPLSNNNRTTAIYPPSTATCSPVLSQLSLASMYAPLNSSWLIATYPRFAARCKAVDPSVSDLFSWSFVPEDFVLFAERYVDTMFSASPFRLKYEAICNRLYGMRLSSVRLKPKDIPSKSKYISLQKAKYLGSL